MKNSRSLVNRMIRAAKLEVNLYEEVEADSTATSQALIAVIVVSLATGIGAGIAGIATMGALGFFWGLLTGLAASLVGWLIWSYLAYILGTRIFKGPETSATWGELLRTIGFAHSPGVLRIFSFIPVIGGIIALGASIWFLIAGVIAVRQALDFSTGRALATCIVGWLIYLVLMLLVYLLLGATALF